MMVLALTALMVFQLAGEMTVQLLGLPVPGPVVGLVLLYAALAGRGRVPNDLRLASNALLQNLMLFLVPATTGLMLHFRRLGDEWLPILLAAVGGTAVTMAFTAITLRLLVRLKRTP
jgi:holin-like protein